MSGWLDAMAADAAGHPQRTKSVILLWLNGGPSTIDLWDLKPDTDHGGPFRSIETATPGVRISEHLPQLARQANELAILRSMTSNEGDHGRAMQFVKTGYLPQAPLQFPHLGALVAHELATNEAALPDFVSIGPTRRGTELGGGFLGPRFSPLSIGADLEEFDGDETTIRLDSFEVPNLSRPARVDEMAQTSRLGLLREFERHALGRRRGEVIESLRAATVRAARLMDPAAADAFRLQDENDRLRDTYGRHVFGQGCLLARRLVEREVPFVEVNLDGWDTHQDNFHRVEVLSRILDSGFAALVGDLKQRGLLDSTLVICQGEFGRTPKINSGVGRDHWPQSWAVALAGGGVQGGRVIGKTTPDGMAVDEHPVTVPDLIATACQAVGIDPRKQNISNVGRPIRIADPAAHVIEGLL
jgi:hypothetical protein